jgi:hypothetical protein
MACGSAYTITNLTFVSWKSRREVLIAYKKDKVGVVRGGIREGSGWGSVVFVFRSFCGTGGWERGIIWPGTLVK